MTATTTPERNPMTTTFATYRQPGSYARNYCTLPTNDVEVIEDVVRHCDQCGEPVHFDRNAGHFGTWVHDSEDVDWSAHRVPTSARRICTYCHVEDGQTIDGVTYRVTYHQMPYSDETRCTRCGGVDGFGIGD